MTFVKVDNIPKMHATRTDTTSDRKPLYSYLKEFVKMDVKYVKVVFASDDYFDLWSAANCLRAAAARTDFPIKVVQRGEDVYLTRTDMEE